MPSPRHPQNARKTAALLGELLRAAVGALVFAAAYPALADGATSANGKASASIDLRIVIPTLLRVRPVSQPASLELEERHVAQGYVDMDSATLVQLTSNSRRGIDLSVAIDPRLVSRAVVRLLDTEVMADAAGGTNRIATARMTDQQVRVSYRLYLQAGAQPGIYRWPVHLRFSPISA